MHLYQSGTPKNDALQDVEDAIVDYRLFSIHGVYKKAVMKWAAGARHRTKRPRHIMLDSGAFTAWNKGDETRIEEVVAAYSDFMQAAGDMFDEVWMINLDKIPGRKGVEPSPEELDEALVVSDRNLEVLQRTFGDRILPVFHQGEPPSRLEVVKAQSRYICVSPRNDLSENVRRNWSLEVHGSCIGWKTHGLAATGNVMMRVVPWTSVDSAAWILHAAYGIVDIFFGTRYKGFFFSEDAGKQKEADIHYNALSALMRSKIDERIALYGFTPDDLKTSMRHRSLVNLGELQAYALHTMGAAKGAQQPSLFGF